MSLRDYRLSQSHIIIAILIGVGGLALPLRPAAPPLSDLVDEQLRNRIEAAGTPPQISIGGELIHASEALPLFYERRGFHPAWSSDQGPSPLADSLLRAIREADRQGLQPTDYHWVRIAATLEEVRQNQKRPRALAPSGPGAKTHPGQHRQFRIGRDRKRPARNPDESGRWARLPAHPGVQR